MARSTQHGGSANISGVVYQMLWCLLRALQIRVKAPFDSNARTEALLVLEPKGGGGDVRVGSDVEQLKAKSDAGKWSLQTVITDVLPDLFMAVGDGARSTRYRFVTEGTLGDWDEVYRFFRRLGNVEPPAGILSQLDDKVPLRFLTTRRKSQVESKDSSLFTEQEYPERAMFCLIAKVLKERPAIKKLALSDTELQRRLWRLLGAFEFVGGQDRESVAREIDQLLLAVVDRSDSIPQTRAALASSLMELAATGNVSISAEELLSRYNLNATPLTDWRRIRSKSQDELQRILANNRYDTRLDVRLKNVEAIAAAWGNSPRTLVVTGESGQGKTWTLAGLASCASRDSAPVLWVEASGNTREDLDRAAHQFWLDMRGGEQPIPLRQISSKLSEVVPSPETLRLRLCLDNVNDYNEAGSIVRENWPSLGISVAMCCPREVASSLQEAFGDRVSVVTCEDFSWEELHELLERQIGETWTEIHEDVRETLRRPLLASIYLDELEAQWHPAHEYELYARMWRRLATRQQAAFPLDVPRLESLAERVLNGEQYPWDYRQLLSPGIDDAFFQRLERCGWLARVGDDHIRVYHDRLLNWAVAQSLFSSLRKGKRTVDDFVVQVAELNRREIRSGHVFLGYVPMDVLWLVCGDSVLAADSASRLLAAFESSYDHQPEVFYRELVPTLGERVADPLFTRCCEFEGYPWALTEVARALATVGKGRIAEFARSLLTNSDPHVQRRGLKLLRQATGPEVLDEIWRVHVCGTLDSGPFLDEHEQDWSFREDSRTALRRSAVNAPAWIVRQIEQADPEMEPVHDLAWLIVNLPDGKRAWGEAKKALFQKVSADRPRILAKCVGQFRDVEYVAWLKAKLSEQRDLCGPVAIQSLSRIDPVEAARSIDKVDQRDLHVTSSWSFREVWIRQQYEVTNRLLEWVDEMDDPWEIGLLFRHYPNDVPPGIFARMLDHLDQQLAEQLTAIDAKSDSFYRELDFLAEVVCPELAELLEQKRDTTFELNLTEYLRRIGARKGIWADSLVREPGVRVPRRINGKGVTRLVNEYLQCDNRFGRLDAWEWVVKNPDDETFRLAAERSQSDELWENHPAEQNDAIELLAVHGQWEAAAIGVCRWGLKTKVNFSSTRLVPHGYSAEWLDSLRAQVKSHPTPGNAKALAFAGNASDASALHAILASNPTDTDLRHACIIGLEMLGDETDEGVRLVARHFDDHRHSVTRMLTQAATPAAWDALWHDLHNHFDHITALNLMNLSSHADRVAELTERQLPNQSKFGDWFLLRVLILRLRPEFKQRLLQNPWLRETFHREAVAAEGRSWLVGSKATAVECLAEFDAKAAFEAASQALRTVEWHDRERYPYLLLKIDPSRAVPVLLEQLESEKNGHVRYAIGRVLSEVALADVLTPRWDSPLPQVRSSACFAASWAKDGPQLEARIRICLDDRAESVIIASLDAISRLRQRQTTAELRDRMACANGLIEKWRWIDDLIDCMDPGDEFQPWPEILRSACDGLSPVVVKFANNRLKQRRKKLHDELKREKHDDE